MLSEVKKYLTEKAIEFKRSSDEWHGISSDEINDFGEDDGSADVSNNYGDAARLCQYFVNLIEIEEIKSSQNINLTKIVEFLKKNEWNIRYAKN